MVSTPGFESAGPTLVEGERSVGPFVVPILSLLTSPFDENVNRFTNTVAGQL